MAHIGLLRRLTMERWFYTWAYWRRRAPWDTGVTPPELVRVVEGAGPEHMSPGRALDLGCGTGTNTLYLARHGWEATGVDFVASAVARARAKAARAGKVDGSARFVRGDVTQLDRLDVTGPYQLILDLGCFHSVTPAGRTSYATGVTRLTNPGAQLWLYALEPTTLGTRAIGLTRDEIAAAFAPAWSLERVERGTNPNGRASAWYWLRRVAHVAEDPRGW